MTEVVKFDHIKLADKVKERIDNVLADLIPAETWKTMIETEVKAFLSDTEVGAVHFDRRTQPAKIKTLIQEQLAEFTKKKIAEYFQSSEWEVTWDQATGNRTKITEHVEALATKLAPAMMASFFQNLAADTLQKIASSSGRGY